MLRVKAEDLRLYDYSGDTPILLEDDTATLGSLELKDGQNILVESESHTDLHVLLVSLAP